MFRDFRSVLDEEVSKETAESWLARDGWVLADEKGFREDVFEVGRENEAAGTFWAHPTGQGRLRLSVAARTRIVYVTFSLETTSSLRRQADFVMGALALDEVLVRVRSSDNTTCMRGLALLGALAPDDTREVYLAWTAGLFHPNIEVRAAALRAVGVLTALVEVPLTASLGATVYDELCECPEPELRELVDELCASFDRLIASG